VQNQWYTAYGSGGAGTTGQGVRARR
jgi:hypothetical protein